MKIYKLAQGRKATIIRYILDLKTGKVKTDIVDHEGGAHCKDRDSTGKFVDEVLTLDMLDFSVESSEKTEEFFQTPDPVSVPKTPAKAPAATAPASKPVMYPGQKTVNKPRDLGMGV